MKYDADMVEINPLIADPEGNVIALDAKMSIDSNASSVIKLFSPMKMKERRIHTRQKLRSTISTYKLAGNIGCMVNGAGLAMATMDIIKHYGSEPANFDAGGSAKTEQSQKH